MTTSKTVFVAGLAWVAASHPPLRSRPPANGPETPVEANTLPGVTYGADRFVAVARAALFSPSRDGLSWTAYLRSVALGKQYADPRVCVKWTVV